MALSVTLQSSLPSRGALNAEAVLESLATGPDCPGTLAVAVPGLVEYQASTVLPLASAGKLLLLVETARQISVGTLDSAESIELLDADYCGGSGVLTGLTARRWTVGDLALLTASVSDNTATNALLRRVGLDAVNKGAAELGLDDTRILDVIREPRLPEHEPTFAVGTAHDLAALAARIANPGRGDEAWARLVLGWLAGNTDRSMVPALIPHDPEDGRVPDGLLATGSSVLWIADKTGTDVGIRSDVGVVVGPARRVGYAVLSTCEAGREFEMIQVMRAVGLLVAEFASRP